MNIRKKLLGMIFRSHKGRSWGGFVFIFLAIFPPQLVNYPNSQPQPNDTVLIAQDGIYLEYAKQAANWLASQAVEVSPGVYKWPMAEEDKVCDIGIESGAAGVGIFYLELYEFTGDVNYLDYAEGGAKYLSQHTYQEGEIDWLSGAAGVGCYFIKLWRLTGDDFYLSEARRAADWLIEKHYEENGGYYWKHYPDFPKIYTGFAHGSAGIGYFFAELYEETGNETYLNYAKGAATWILSYMWEPETGKYCWPRLTTDSEPNTTWCGGSVGIILFLLKLYDVTGDDVYLNYAVGGTDWLVDQAKEGGNGSYKWSYGPGSFSFPFAYCHGTPSVVHLLYEMYRRTGSTRYLTYAQGGAKWLEQEAEKVSDHIYRWPHIKGLPHDTGLLTGTAGVGNSFTLYYPYDEEESYLEYAKGAAFWLISVAECPKANEVKWINYVDERDPDYSEKLHETGWYSGTAGIGIFFLHMAQLLPPQKGIVHPI